MLYNSLLIDKGITRSQKFNEDIIDLCKCTFVLPEQFNYRIIKVTESMVARPDLLSYKIYGNEVYGDLICKINGISNPFELNKDMLLLVPVVEDIDKFFIKDEYDNHIDDDTNIQKAKPKAKNEKRTANEAVIGDSRFKIDAANRVIIY